MAIFTYKAMTQDGQIVDGQIDAGSRDEVRRRLEYLDLFLIKLSVANAKTWGSSSGSRRLSPVLVTEFTRNLAFMLEAGFRIEQSLDMLADPLMCGSLAPTVKSLAAMVRAGDSFASALQRFDTIFPPLYVAIVKIGESSGQLAAEMQVLATLRSRMEATRARIFEQIRYPAFILLLAGTVLIFFLRIVLPQFATTLRDLGASMDSATYVLLSISDFVTENGAALLFAVSAFSVVVALLLRGARGRALIARLWCSVPVVRGLLSEYRTAIFCRALGYLLQNGMSLSKALPLAAGTLSGGVPHEAWVETLAKLRHGGSLASALAENSDVTVLARRMLALGEQTGRLGAVSLQAADLFDLRLDRGLKRIVDIAGPVAILATSLVVGLLVVTLMNALMSVGQLAN